MRDGQIQIRKTLRFEPILRLAGRPNSNLKSVAFRAYFRTCWAVKFVPKPLRVKFTLRLTRQSNSGLKVMHFEPDLAPAERSNLGLKALYFELNLALAAWSNSGLESIEL